MSEATKQSFSILAVPPQEMEYNQDLYSALRLNMDAMQRGREPTTAGAERRRGA